MRKVTEFEERTISYNAGTTSQLAIGFKDYWITGMLIGLDLWKYDAVSPSAYQDWAWRSISTLLLAEGRRKYVAANGPDLRPLAWGVRQRMHGQYRPLDWETGGTAGAPILFPIRLPLFFSPDPLLNQFDQRFDKRVGIRPSSGLVMNVGWAANTATGANTTIHASTQIQLTYFGIKLEPGDQEPQYYPNWNTSQYTPASTHAALRGTFNVDTNVFHRRTHQVLTKGASPNDNRYDGRDVNAGALEYLGISEVGFLTGKQQDPFLMKTWDATVQSQSAFLAVADDNAAVPGATAAYGAATTKADHNPGVFHFDWIRLAGKIGAGMVDPVWGADLHGKQDTALQLGYTVDNVASSQSALIFQEAYDHY